MPDIHHNPAAHCFESPTGARLDYQITDGKMILTHTWVPPDQRGQGLAGSLTRAALDHANAAGLRIIPECSYAAAFLRRHPPSKGSVVSDQSKR